MKSLKAHKADPPSNIIDLNEYIAVIDSGILYDHLYERGSDVFESHIKGANEQYIAEVLGEVEKILRERLEIWL